MKRSHVLNDREIKRVFAAISRSAYSFMLLLEIVADLPGPTAKPN